MNKNFTPFWALASGQGLLIDLEQGLKTVEQVVKATGRTKAAVQTAWSHYRKQKAAANADGEAIAHATRGHLRDWRSGATQPVLFAGQRRVMDVRNVRQRDFRGRNSIRDLIIYRDGTISAVIMHRKKTVTRVITLVGVAADIREL